MKKLAKPDALAALRKAALSHSHVQEAVACEGTVIQSASFKVNGKAFLFLRPRVAMLKLEKSLGAVAKLAAQNPATYKVGSSGWFTISDPGTVSLPLMQRWIRESYDLHAASKPTKPTQANQAAARPPNNRMKLTKRPPFKGRRAFARLRHQVALRSLSVC